MNHRNVHPASRFPNQEVNSTACCRLVLSAYPKLGVGMPTRTEYQDHFERAFLALCYIRRRPEVDKQRTMSFWRDLGSRHLVEPCVLRRSSNLAPFVAAVVAHGDVVSHASRFIR